MKKIFTSVCFCVLMLTNLQLKAQCTVDLGPDLIACPGGFVTLDAGGGFSTYTWSTAQATQTITVSITGVYYVTVTDGLGNTCSDTIVVNFAPSMMLTLNCINASCSACNDGSITATIMGGSPPYTYWWSNGAVMPFITNLSTGVYTVMVTDMMGCTATASCAINPGIAGTGPYMVSGTVYFDTDSSGTKNAGESGIPSVKVGIDPDSLVVFTDSSGNYAFWVDSGTKVVNVYPETSWNVTSGSSASTVNVVSGNYPGNDFGLRCPQSGEISCNIEGSLPRCGWTVPFWINTNLFTYDSLNGYVKVVLDTAVNFMSANPPVTSISGDTLIWNFTTGIGSNPLYYTCYLQMPSTIGYAFYIAMETAMLDSNNAVINSCTDTVYKTITCSFDPNDKAVYPEGAGPQHYIFVDINPSLDYTIRFQNTGTDTAFNVMITDELDPHLDVSTFEFTGSSHPVNVTLLGHHAEFRFNNILLPDSNVDEQSSHGYISYRCNPVYPTTSYVLNNIASIFFDANSPVITNTVFNTIDISVGVNEFSFQQDGLIIFPNPFTETTTIKFENELHDPCELKIYDLIGRTVRTQLTSSDYFVLERKLLYAGVYLLSIANEKNSSLIHGKVVMK